MKKNPPVIYFLIITIAILLHSCESETNGRGDLRIGNKQYNRQSYNDAESSYLKSIEQCPSAEALYGRGNSSQRLSLSAPSDKLSTIDSVALSTYQMALDQCKGNNLKKSKIYHNMGNLRYMSGMRNKKMQQLDESNKHFQESIDYYESSLRLNSKDDDTRYNLAMAQYMLEKNREEQNNQNQNKDQNQNNQSQNQNQKENKDQQNDSKDKDDQKQNKDENKNDNQNKNQNEKNKDKDKKNNQDKDSDKDKKQDNQDENKKQQDDKNQNNQQNNQQDKQQNNQQNNQDKNNPSGGKSAPKYKVNGKIDDKTANQLLNAAQQDENKVQKKIEKAVGVSGSYEKDW